MRRRRKQKTPADELRRLALAERWEEVRTLLTERLSQDPHDAEARREMERLQQGLPLRATESSLARKRREEQEMQEELTAELELYASRPAMVQEWAYDLLCKRRQRLSAILRRLGKRLPTEQLEGAAAYRAALSAQIKQCRNKRRRRLLLTIGLPLLLAGAASLALCLNRQAEQAEDALRRALQRNSIPEVEEALRKTESGIIPRLAPNLRQLIHRAQVWKAQRQKELAALQACLDELEAGFLHISMLPLAQRAALERTLQNLPQGMEDMGKRWKRLCDAEAQNLARQRDDILRRFSHPLPPLPEPCGNPADDDACLRQEQEQLRQLTEEWENARFLYKPVEDYGTPLRERSEEILRRREGIATYRRVIALLPSARSYARYRELLTCLRPARYAPAQKLAVICDSLPDEEHLREQMLNLGRQIQPGMAEAASHAHLEGGPTFTPAFPANAQQLQIMEDVFTATVLQKVLYEMSASTLPAFIVEERPEVNEESVSFTPSPLTPGYTLNVPRRITWHNPQAVYIRRIDTTRILPGLGISRENFFTSANLPALLDTLLRFTPEACPALARAYVFKRLLDVMKAHEWPTMLGLSCAPTLRSDARAFEQLTAELGFPLEAGCWLKNSPEIARAEELCTRWFHERRHHHYAQEIERNFRALVQVHPRYVGFINASGKPCLYRQLPEGSLLWYMTENGLTATPLSEALDAPIPYSPVFIVAKD